MPLTGAQIFQMCILVVYLVVLLILGKKSSGQVKSNTDYLLSGRQMSWLIVAAGLVGTNFSGAVITSVSNFAYTYGLGGTLYEGCTVIGFLICAALYAKRARLSGAFTISELFEIRYGFNVRMIAGFFIMLSGISAAAAQFKAIGLIFNSMFGLPENLGIIIAWVITIFYMTMGGLAASNYTIIPQMACCFIAFPVVAFWAIGKFGGFNAIAAMPNLPETYFTFFGPSIKLVLTWVLQWMWVNEWGSQWYFQRASAARSVKHAKRGFLVAGIVLAIMVLIPGTLIGMMGRVAFPDLINSEASLSLMVAAAPVLAGGLAMTGIFAAAMSTVDGCAMGAVTVIVRDFYQRALGHMDTDSKKINRASRIVTIVVLIVVLLMATALKSVAAGLNFIFVFSTGNFGALVAALFWKKASKEGALLSIIIAGVVAMAWTFMGGSATFEAAWWSLMLSMTIMVVVSLIVSKTGPWWGKKAKPARAEVKADILDFLSNRTATMADFIDRFKVNTVELRLAVSELTMSGKICEVDYLTYSLKENCEPGEVYTKDGSTARDVTMIIAALVCIAGFAAIWIVTH